MVLVIVKALLKPKTFLRFLGEIIFSAISSMWLSWHSNPRPCSKESETRDWLDLPRDVTAKILQKLGAIEILMNAQLVCTEWRNICFDSLMWRTIDMRIDDYSYISHFNLRTIDVQNKDYPYDLRTMCRKAINRSCGQLVDINVEHFGTDDLLEYITYSISDRVLSEVAKKLPMLEELDISFCYIRKDGLQAIGQCCPLLKSLKFNAATYDSDEEAFAIARTMPQLSHLELSGNKLTNVGLLAILDGCPHIQYLDLRSCLNVDLGSSLGRRCAQQIKELREPNAPTDIFRNYYEAGILKKLDSSGPCTVY
ncbi:putative F-box/LRR-repeat protein 23 [Gastrolobium bilobum]|uniref:putative F-box/LRR-repeat protein 23 n=1 Tax=Gastrolobium bilobum TaxID=150636 RepID=UPI002AB003A8|nr:putative F-box/LRR-repeat protein 23 [Gastrolobium bilobum]